MKKVKTAEEHFRTAQTLFYIMLGLNMLGIFILSLLVFSSGYSGSLITKPGMIMMIVITIGLFVLLYWLFIMTKKGSKLAFYIMSGICVLLVLANILQNGLKGVIGAVLMGFFLYNSNAGLELFIEREREGLKMDMGLGGFEPPARSLGNCCSILLSYNPI